MLSILSGSSSPSLPLLMANIVEQLDQLKRPDAIPAVAGAGTTSNHKSQTGTNKDDSSKAKSASPAISAQANDNPPLISAPLTSSVYFAEIYGQYIPQVFKTQLPYAKFLEYSAVKDKYIEPSLRKVDHAAQKGEPETLEEAIASIASRQSNPFEVNIVV